ncbi:MAG: Uncharacterised protein [Bacteroidetes bacterium MED-G17]|nr:MAG: Uncharacterised protein [Bacteroidetes bacterium MED-G17]
MASVSGINIFAIISAAGALMMLAESKWVAKTNCSEVLAPPKN